MSYVTQNGDRPCPVCASVGATVFYSLSDAPVTCTSVFPDPASARAVPVGSIRLACCERCGFIFNRAFDPVLAQIGARYESSQASSAHFGGYARSLAREWIDRYSLRGKRVLEIGCGHGEFLAELVRGGAGEALGVDPLADPARIPTDCADRIRVEPEPFGEKHVNLTADAIVCRHTLEHVHDVSGFLRMIGACASHNRGAVVLFEVPATERVLSESAFWDVYYEHCCYFTESSLQHAFRLAGFRVTRTALLFDRQYLILEAAMATGKPDPSPEVDAADALSGCLAFGERSTQVIGRCRNRLRSLAAEGRPVVVWQGAAKTVGFISTLADDQLVDCAVDVSVHRQGQFLPPSGLPVFAPEELKTLRPRNIVLMNPVYHGEVRANLDALGLATVRLLTVNQLRAERADWSTGG